MPDNESNHKLILPEILKPSASHDGYSFEQLGDSYNFQRTSDRRGMFVRLMIRELATRPGPHRVLDIGCGGGMGQGPEYVRAFGNSLDEFWGIEPDPNVEIPDDLFKTVQRSLLEDAQLPENYFDIAYAFLVMEHVDDPVSFMRSVHRCLKPGGLFYFLTPNGHHYFTLLARTLRLIHLDEFILRLIRGDVVEEYHYPVRYRFNRPSQVRRAIAQLGFDSQQFLYLEEEGPKPYFPGPSVLLFHLLAAKRKLIHHRGCLLDFVGRIQKSPAD